MRNSRRTFSLAFAATPRLAHCFLSLVAAAGGLATPAWADLLPPGATFAQCSADGNSTFDSTFCDVGGVAGVPSHFRAGAELLGPSVFATATSPSNAVFGAGGFASASYSFEVTGGNPGDIVPILLAFNLSASAGVGKAGSGTYGKAVLTYRTTADRIQPHIVQVCTDVCADSALFATVKTIAASGSLDDFVAIRAQAHTDATGLDEFASALADPYIYIDPDFANASLYSIVVSAGVGNGPAAAVPEPATLTLLGTAIGTLCLIRHRHSRRSA